MSFDAAVSGLDALLEQTRQALERAGEPVPGGKSASGTGTGADGLVKVRVGPRHVESLSVDPRAMRLGSQALADQIRSAVNAAFDDLWKNAGGAEAVAKAQEGKRALTAQLQNLQDESMRNMTMFTQAVADAVAALNRERE